MERKNRSLSNILMLPHMSGGGYKWVTAAISIVNIAYAKITLHDILAEI